jgi:phosphocarrier protein HPr
MAQGRATRTVTVSNKRGLHTRTSARFAELAGSYRAPVTVETRGGLCEGVAVAATSIMGLMMLGARAGDKLVITAEGSDADAALDALCALVVRGFDEVDDG